MERRQNGGRQRYIVQQFVKNISDDTERLVCFLYMRNASDKEICKQLKSVMNGWKKSNSNWQSI